ncbi:heme-binding protein [Saccharospirillum salsuginis]|uniref:Glc operon protein GlcG n=1 Tax=Saccharospirillum salsuginis TaxID=418750 RepID=A0A918K5D0_9GAMM|nr:heme-binding protein [Saccharospirillum salsuginis]GGX45870.1 hypothetical protein GCM10007392_11130 [Saccharospirillum salsuginis]
MLSKALLSITDANGIIDAALIEAEQHHWHIAIAVVDDGGHPLALHRMDNSAPISAYLALEKARSAALGRRETKLYEDMINQGRFAFLSVPEISGTLEGGVPVVVDGQVVAAVGVSGVLPHQDAQVAKAGVEGLALEAV